MYVPNQFREDDAETLLAEMRRQAAATLVSQGPEGLIASHVPVELAAGPAPWGLVRCHLARANPHADVLAAGGEVLLIFQGAEGYVSPSHYPSKAASGGKAVPTWNYVAIHAYGRATPFEGEAALRPHLAALTARHEAGRAEPWGLGDAPDDFIAMMCKAIIGIAIAPTRVEGKWKMSQNRPPADREGTAAGLRAEGRPDLADLVEAAAKRRG
ncbi:MAG: FMN-binding negative transcriptional regulator [Alphaproteobacteria bacterium]|nr:FMN-binding negative transcriptional regulator [Alphaproteobacteria bacterium]MCB9928406.1 FMN-binding negative transcriptional regulator [Alphaproteobacteria bacterium]